MKVSNFIFSICKFAEPKSVADYPPMEFQQLRKAIEYMNAEIKLPHDIIHWDKTKIENYLEKTRQKKAHIEEWIFAKRHILREPNYKDLQEAFFRLQQRWDRKIKHLKKLTQNQSV